MCEASETEGVKSHGVMRAFALNGTPVKARYDQTEQLQLYMYLCDSSNRKHPSPFTVCLRTHYLLASMIQRVDYKENAKAKGLNVGKVSEKDKNRPPIISQ